MRNADSSANSTPGAAGTARPSFKVWSWVLVPLVLAASLAVASISPWLVPPYLVLMAAVLFGPSAAPGAASRVETIPGPPESCPVPSEPLPPEPPEPDLASTADMTTSAERSDASTATATKTRKRKSRAKSRSKDTPADGPDPPTAAWVCVGPGKYVRIEGVEPNEPQDPGSTENQPSDPPLEPAGVSLPEPEHPAVEIEPAAPLDPEPFQEPDQIRGSEPVDDFPASELIEAEFTSSDLPWQGQIDTNGFNASFTPDDATVMQPLALDYHANATHDDSEFAQGNLEDREFGDAHPSYPPPEPVLELLPPEPDQTSEPDRLDAGPDPPEIDDLPAIEPKPLDLTECVQDQDSIDLYGDDGCFVGPLMDVEPELVDDGLPLANAANQEPDVETTLVDASEDDHQPQPSTNRWRFRTATARAGKIPRRVRMGLDRSRGRPKRQTRAQGRRRRRLGGRSRASMPRAPPDGQTAINRDRQ